MFGCDYEAWRRRSKGQISDIHRKSEKAREGAHLHTHLCVRLLNDRPDLLCHASVSQLKTSLVRFHSPLSLAPSFISGSRSISPLEDDQSRADRSEITLRGAEKER